MKRRRSNEDADVDSAPEASHTADGYMSAPTPIPIPKIAASLSISKKLPSTSGNKQSPNTQYRFRVHQSKTRKSGFQCGEPSQEYLSLAKIPSSSLDPPRKLVVLDLNGTLVHRRRFGLRTAMRPYLRTLIELVPMVWSSAQPRNVKKMVDEAFGPQSQHLKAVWARDTLGLSTEDYGKNVETVKNLELVWGRLSDDSEKAGGKPFTYNALNTILVDNSPIKAHMQPHNHICVPEYAHELDEIDSQRFLAGPEDDSRLLSEEDARIGISSRYDLSLVAVIGVLDELAGQDSVCSWIRSDGLRNVPEVLIEDGKEVKEFGRTDDGPYNEGGDVRLRSVYAWIRFWLTSFPKHSKAPAPELEMGKQEECPARTI
ncbi:uncharacterized protein EI90DRAFT_3155925 [Cantharellus anzutake]|uniref:uncharacterized protein n=1 Tax=Cantharellus anzutake TaxID=1750568 RepID=UPI001908769E|nr:uncharacterized protein EI90DRAFT_3155925 [Cantharellus anzutake]KAF8328208.1 hypothetical protein EI90DRAFT_3155925 [Cantharellus anzutake]